MRKFFFILSFIFLFANKAFAHSGGTNAYGCHNCYTAECYGVYHCHNPKFFFEPEPTFFLPKPTAPDNAEITQVVSSENWCAYDVSISWKQPAHGDRFSLAISKVAGGDPGPLVDTSALNFTFKNVAPGKWFINFKSGNSERWGDVSYWEIELPKLKPEMSAFIEKFGDSQFLKYSFSCLEKVAGPQQFMNHLFSNGNTPSGLMLLNGDTPSTIEIKGYDKNGKVYERKLLVTSTKQGITKTQETERGVENFDLILVTGAIFLLLSAVWFIQHRLQKK